MIGLGADLIRKKNQAKQRTELPSLSVPGRNRPDKCPDIDERDQSSSSGKQPCKKWYLLFGYMLKDSTYLQSLTSLYKWTIGQK